MNVVGYIRVSTQGQAWDGYRLKYQEDEIKVYCDESSLNLINVFRDEGINGAKLNEEALELDRVGLQEMLAHLSSVRIDYVVVLNTSILDKTGEIKKYLDEAGVDGVEYKNGMPDFSPFSKGEIELENMTNDRKSNFSTADEELAKKWSTPEQKWTAEYS